MGLGLEWLWESSLPMGSIMIWNLSATLTTDPTVPPHYSVSCLATLWAPHVRRPRALQTLLQVVWRLQPLLCRRDDGNCLLIMPSSVRLIDSSKILLLTGWHFMSIKKWAASMNVVLLSVAAFQARQKPGLYVWIVERVYSTIKKR